LPPSVQERTRVVRPRYTPLRRCLRVEPRFGRSAEGNPAP